MPQDTSAIRNAIESLDYTVVMTKRQPNDKASNYYLHDGTVVAVYDTGSIVVQNCGEREAMQIKASVLSAHAKRLEKREKPLFGRSGLGKPLFKMTKTRAGPTRAR